jgi:hypothetical protein
MPDAVSNEQNNRAKAALAFRIAMAFEKTAEVLAVDLRIMTSLDREGRNVIPQKRIDAMLPFALNHAFSAELHLKCLCLLESGQHITGHELSSVFRKVSLKSRDRIESHYQNIAATFKPGPGTSASKPASFAAMLEEHKNLFVDARYLFEKASGINFDIFPICLPIRRRTLELQPDWTNTVDGLRL